MPIKIKIFVSFLGLVAASLVYLGLSNLKLDQNLNQANIKPSLERDTDWDDDGLPNREESYWNTDPNNPDTDGDGYLDGEEVASGHDPLRPGPDDKRSTPDSVNITDKVSALMAAGYYAGDLSADADPETYNKALADISTEALIDGARALNPDNISISNLKTSSDSKKDQEKYINSIGLIVQDVWGEIVSEPRSTAERFINFYSEDTPSADESREHFKSKSDYYAEIIADINEITVPPSWLDIHREIVTNLQTLAVSHRAVSQTSEDPLKGVFGINNLTSTYQNIQPLLGKIMDKINKNDLSPPNGQLWDLINSLFNDF